MSSVSQVNPLDEPEPISGLELSNRLHQLIADFRASKPNDRSSADRFWAIAITHLEDAESTLVARILLQDSTKQGG